MELVSAVNVGRLKNILLNTQLEGAICIEIPCMQLKLDLNAVSASEQNYEVGYDMKKTYFKKNEEDTIMSIKNRKYKMFYNLGEWGYDTRIAKSHICLGTTPTKFGTDYFAQIELSQALEDDLKIYIVKNISKLSGEGSISRLNNGLGKNKDAKHQRRTNLVDSLGKKIIDFDKREWMCLVEIDKADMLNEAKSGKIVTNIMENFIQYALRIEEIIYEDKQA